ncbi:hypothetical protein [Phenylobacterium sp. SCN 70-31]|uniref:hypothetical protein n=1 Tax=Phenylobacterium sp. SCN 70-31 TaxID=1660129 RepID=UPI0026012165|nr:hypothetical protein [Phenylobacterium sp. SCN 70-31]
MSPEFWIWMVGNLIMPAIPVACVYFAQRTVGQAPTPESVLKDGVLFFYGIAVAALLIMDLWKDRISAAPKVDPGHATIFISVALVSVIFISGAYFVTALLHTGKLNTVEQGAQKGYDMKRLAHFSWQSAAAMIILSLIARIGSGLY